MSLMREWQQKSADTQPHETGKPQSAVQPVRGSIGRQQRVELISNALAETLKSLSMLRSSTAKAVSKREHVIPQFREYVEWLKAEGLKHELLTYFMIWLFDIREIEEAIDMGFHCLKNDIPMPERFKRPVYIVMADEVLGWAEEEHKADRNPEPYFSEILTRIKGSEDAEPWDLPDELSVKYFKLAGQLDSKAGRFEDALEHLELASEMGAPVKGLLKDVQKRLKAKA